MPLKDNNPVLVKTKDSILTIRNSIIFVDYNIIKSSQPEDISKNKKIYINCIYHPITSPHCTRFKLGDIIKFTANANGTYEQVAKFGAIIQIAIKWNCWLSEWFSSNKICLPTYSFERIDDDYKANDMGHTTYVTQTYYKNGQKRTTIRSHRLRFQVKVTGSISQYDFYNFITVLSAYSGIFALLLIPFQMAIVHRLKKYHIEDWVTLEV